MPAPVLIVGQGVAGSALAWACEEAGIDFELADAGHVSAASRVGAGIVNPVTGRRLAPTWRFDEGIWSAVAMYRRMERELGMSLVRPMRVYRRFRNPAEKAALDLRLERAPEGPGHVGGRDEDGFWINDAWHVDTAAMIAGLRRRWCAAGRLHERAVDPLAEAPLRDVTVLCSGAEVAAVFDFIPWERSVGEVLTGTTEGLDPGVILNCGQWALPLAEGLVRVGATYARTAGPAVPTAEGREALSQSAADLLGTRPFVVTGHEAGVRLGVKDRRPCVGRHPAVPSIGMIGGLGSKGALWAPGLARQWVNHLTEGVPFDPETDLNRFRR